ncbi:MAG TPA: decaprenyl-phosphate phosphoribosyltransferase [Propionibacteriaceae bacterium]|nr:decaprenyl-phosphate phosphoribosyltransferase [Propionibacteriaceae bacterium]
MRGSFFGGHLRGEPTREDYHRASADGRVHSPPATPMVVALVKTCRPHQWIKNLFVAAPLVFSRRIDDPEAALRAMIAVACFCLLSSAVYLLNDVLDIERDRAHPLKRLRPVASGALPVPIARSAAAIFAVTGLLVAALIAPLLAVVAASYLLLNIAYSLHLKRIPFVDVACISLGFLLRVLGGAFAIAVEPSGWLLACTLLLAALLGFGKRAHELRVSGDKRATQRIVLDRYPPGVLRVLLISLSILTTITYAAYTQSPHALEFFGTRRLALTIPFAAFGIGRFLWMTSRKLDDESPTDSMLRDKLFLLNLFAYTVAIVLIIYRGG